MPSRVRAGAIGNRANRYCPRAVHPGRNLMFDRSRQCRKRKGSHRRAKPVRSCCQLTEPREQFLADQFQGFFVAVVLKPQIEN
jgi:hypothetical protein